MSAPTPPRRRDPQDETSEDLERPLTVRDRKDMDRRLVELERKADARTLVTVSANEWNTVLAKIAALEHRITLLESPGGVAPPPGAGGGRS